MRKNLAQSAIEYLVISALVLAAIGASNFIGNLRNNTFEKFFQKAKNAMLN